MPSIQLSPLLHYHLLNFLKRLCVIRDKLWNFGIRQISFLQAFFRRCLSLIIGRFVSKRQAESPRNHPSTQYDKADHHSQGLFDNVDCFRKLPISFFGRWRRSQSLPLHHEHYYHPDPQTLPSTSQAVVPYSTTPMARDDMNMSTRNNYTCSSTTAGAEDDFNRDPHPPGLSKEISDFVGVTSYEFERYERNFTSYVLTTDHQS
jgi:hypothetical protein